jgi:hypothetical protein
MKTINITILSLLLTFSFASGVFAGEICTCNPGPVCFDNMGKVIGCSGSCVALCNNSSVSCGSTGTTGTSSSISSPLSTSSSISNPSKQPVDTDFLKNKFDPNLYLNSLMNERNPLPPLSKDDIKNISEIMNSFIEKQRQADEAQREEDEKILRRAVDNAELDESRAAQKLLYYTTNWKKYSISSNLYTGETGFHQMLAALGNSGEYVEEQKKKGVSEEEAEKAYNKLYGGLIEKYKGEKIEEQTESDKAKYESIFRHPQPAKEEETKEMKEQEIFDPEPYIKSLKKDQSKSSPGPTEAMEAKLSTQETQVEIMASEWKKKMEAARKGSEVRKDDKDSIDRAKSKLEYLMSFVKEELDKYEYKYQLLGKYIDKQGMQPDQAVNQLLKDIQSDAEKNVENGMDANTAMGKALESRGIIVYEIDYNWHETPGAPGTYY